MFLLFQFFGCFIKHTARHKWELHSYGILRRVDFSFSFCDRVRVLIYILKNLLFALKYALKHSLIKNKLISTPTCFGPIRPSSGSCRAQLLRYVQQFTFVLRWLCSTMQFRSGYVPLSLLTCLLRGLCPRNRQSLLTFQDNLSVPYGRQVFLKMSATDYDLNSLKFWKNPHLILLLVYS